MQVREMKTEPSMAMPMWACLSQELPCPPLFAKAAVATACSRGSSCQPAILLNRVFSSERLTLTPNCS